MELHPYNTPPSDKYWQLIATVKEKFANGTTWKPALNDKIIRKSEGKKPVKKKKK